MTDWAQLSPVIYGCKYEPLENGLIEQFDVSTLHPVCYGFKFEQEGDANETTKRSVVKSDSYEIGCDQRSAKEYLEKEIFPVLLPALDEMLRVAVDNDVLKWKRTKFNACDFLTEYLYNHNPSQSGREATSLWEIPFVQRINAVKPRPPLPLSLIWTDEQAAVIIQSFWRGCMVRMDEEVQELRKYQKEMREQEYDIMLKVEDFWKKHPVEEESDDTPA